MKAYKRGMQKEITAKLNAQHTLAEQANISRETKQDAPN